jgi:hypothetical protein
MATFEERLADGGSVRDLAQPGEASKIVDDFTRIVD